MAGLGTPKGWLAVALLALAVGLGLRACRGGGARGPAGSYVDEETLDPVDAPAGRVTPFEGPRGRGTIVDAVYATNAAGARRLVYLIKHTPEGRVAAEKRARGIPPDPGENAAAMLVRAPEPGSPWLPADSPAGQRIVGQAAKP
jgi:hypothetical protein